ncbi:PAS domain S-box protein [Pseudonocardia acaciae]|uniref:PAS domain S-box protein n=1 Tax=Pseudonocardia acaciae TaxID=551276 RepID=UPI000685A245|nr:PAS domain S-box protein [Pseudonocardia acaciae]
MTDARPNRTIEQVLADGGGLLEVLFHRTPMAIAVLDRDLVLQRFNKTFASAVERHGAIGAAQVGDRLLDHFPGADEQTREMFEPVFAGETRWHHGVPYTADDDSVSYWDLVLVPLRDDGPVVGVVEIFTEATERVSAVQDLRRSERRFRSILLNSSDITIVIDTDWMLRYVAPSVRRLLDIPDERALSEGRTMPVHPDDVATVRAALEHAATVPGESPPFRARLRHADHTWHTFEVEPVNLLDDPDVEGIVLHARDITERTHAEAELHRRDAIMEAVRFAAHRFLESHASWRVHIHEVMARLGLAAAVSRVYIFENFRGADGSQWTSQSHEWVAPGISPQIDNTELAASSLERSPFARTARVLGAGQVVAGNVADLPADERAVLEPQGILSLVLVPVFVDGRWWGMIGFDECIRERSWSAAEIDALRAAASTLSAAVHRQRAEDQLREQQAQYRQVFEATGDGLVITDLDATLVRANPAFYRMHGFRPEELVGRHATSWTHPDYLEARTAYTAEVIAGERPRTQAVDIRKDGSSFPVQVNASTFTFQGRPHILGVVRDDTERSQAFSLLEKRLSALSTIAASLPVSQALTETLDVITREVVAATPAVACSAYVLDLDSGELRMFSGAGLPDGYREAIEQCWREGADPGSQAYFADEPLIVREAVRQIREMPMMAPLHEVVKDVSWDTVAVVPLASQSRRFGSVNAYYPKDVEPSSGDIAFLRAVADQGAVAVENARLLTEAQSKAGLEERQRLARELHDSVSQALYGIALGARTARAVAEQSPDQLAEPLDYVLSLAEAGMTEMRSLIFELRPESLATEGLVAALDKRVAVLRTRHHLTVRATLCQEPELPLRLKETLYRIAQEALHNAVKHANAGHIDLRLRTTGEHVELEIGDDGVGFAPATEARPGHLGLQSMRERAATHRGTIEIESVVGAGTTVRARLPLPR